METIMKPDFMGMITKIIAEVRNRAYIDKIDTEALEEILQEELKEYCTKAYDEGHSDGYADGYDVGYDDGYSDGGVYVID